MISIKKLSKIIHCTMLKKIHYKQINKIDIRLSFIHKIKFECKDFHLFDVRLITKLTQISITILSIFSSSQKRMLETLS